jgi:folate-dependent phosphoribosylglycinamide formyltransferase PurN
MRIYFLLVDEPFYTSACLEPLLARFGPSVAGAAFPAGFFDWKRLRTTLALYGPFATASRVAKMAWTSIRGGDVHRQFKARSIPVRDIADVNAPAFLDDLRALGVDLIVSLNTPQKLKRPILELPAHGCLNVHFGMLPRYRGLLPIFHAMLNGESSFGVTVHVMDEKLDNGEIVAQRAVPIGAGDTLDTLYPKAFATASELLAEAIDACARGAMTRRPNPAAEKTYYSYPTPEQIREYRRRVSPRHAPSSPKSLTPNP